jgi:hypothetical protein
MDLHFKKKRDSLSKGPFSLTGCLVQFIKLLLFTSLIEVFISLCFKGQPVQTRCERKVAFYFNVRHVLHSLTLRFKALSRNLNKLEHMVAVLDLKACYVMSCDHAVSVSG